MANHCAVFVHIVWATAGRQPWITGSRRRPIYRCIASQARRCGARVIALGGVEDHVHLIVSLPGALSLSALMQAVKGASSAVAAQQEGDFMWQHGYGAFSISPPHVDRAIAYVENQREHHDLQKTWDYWERIPDDDKPSST